MAGTGGPVATFSVWDYVVFAGILLGASGIGLLQAIRSRKQNTSEEFLLGGRQMHAVPVAMSLTASFMSGITVIGTPAESYRFGTAFWLFGLSYIIMATVTAELFVPFFYRLGVTSIYEYLEMRFSKGLVIYAPAIALNQITGLDLWGVLVVTGVVCIIYCTLGGLKAVIWTDVVQLVIMLAGFVAVIVEGTVLQGSLSRIWQDSADGGRLQTFESLYVNLVGLLVTLSLAMFCGLTMYSIYMKCDPSPTIDLLPYLVMDILAAYPGAPGFFVAAAYSGTLSTVSSSINALVAVTVEDFVRPAWKNLTEKQLSWINMGLSEGAWRDYSQAFIITMWVGIGSQIYPAPDDKTNPLLLSTINCINSTGDVYNTTASPWIHPQPLTQEPMHRPALADSWYSLSYLYLSPVGTLCTMAMGLLVSSITGKGILIYIRLPSLNEGGCKQESLDHNLFVKKSDLACFNCCSNGSEMSDMENKNPEETKETSKYHNFDGEEEDEEKVTQF
ncbi:hypothetical protein CRUP_036735 [Coryphaenoides rupestris]|nr:hypothetical protein CRUP_036735 [Coryphaenoides rupestris]